MLNKHLFVQHLGRRKPHAQRVVRQRWHMNSSRTAWRRIKNVVLRQLMSRQVRTVGGGPPRNIAMVGGPAGGAGRSRERDRSRLPPLASFSAISSWARGKQTSNIGPSINFKVRDKSNNPLTYSTGFQDPHPNGYKWTWIVFPPSLSLTVLNVRPWHMPWQRLD